MFQIVGAFMSTSWIRMVTTSVLLSFHRFIWTVWPRKAKEMLSPCVSEVNNSYIGVYIQQIFVEMQYAIRFPDFLFEIYNYWATYAIKHKRANETSLARYERLLLVLPKNIFNLSWLLSLVIRKAKKMETSGIKIWKSKLLMFVA